MKEEMGLDPATKDIVKFEKQKGIPSPDIVDQFESRFTLFRHIKGLLLRILPRHWAKRICPKIGGHWAVELPEISNTMSTFSMGTFYYCPLCGQEMKPGPKHFHCGNDIIPIVEESK